MGIGQPGVKRNKACLDGKGHEEAKKKDQGSRAGNRCRIDSNSLKIKTICLVKHPKKSDHQKYNGKMGLNQIVDACLDGDRIFVLKDDHQKGGQSEDLPRYQKYEAVLDGTNADDGGVLQQKSNTMQREIITLFFIGFQIRISIQGTRQKYQIDDEHEPSRQGIYS